MSVSHRVSPLMKLVARGDTTVVDAYLSPVLRRYVNQVAAQLPGVKLQFMQSSGGLADAQQFHGKDAILSGPAGGIVGAARTAQQAGIGKIISFDMGGTSTDVAHFAGEYERAFDAEVAGVRLRAPMMRIHTVAAGGGSICQFDGVRLRVGPGSAGANPGPAVYRRGGPPTVTDCNVLLGRIQAEFFPSVFGPTGDPPLDANVVGQPIQRAGRGHRTRDRACETPHGARGRLHPDRSREHGERDRETSVQRGHDVTEYTLSCFGGAAGQHACSLPTRSECRQCSCIRSRVGGRRRPGDIIVVRSSTRSRRLSTRRALAALGNAVQRARQRSARGVVVTGCRGRRTFRSSAELHSSTKVRTARCSCRSRRKQWS